MKSINLCVMSDALCCLLNFKISNNIFNKAMISKCAIPPHTHFEHIRKTEDALGLVDDVHMRAIGLNFVDEPMAVVS